MKSRLIEKDKNEFSFLLILTALFGMTITPVGMSAGQEHGRVSMKGSIIDSACAIATQDREQTVDIGIGTMGEIIRNRRGTERPFSIHLVNCSLNTTNPVNSHKDISQFRVTFDGPSEGGMFRLSGASGVGLQIVDINGNVVVPGKSVSAVLQSSSLQMDYIVRLIGNHRRLNAGEYHSTIRFKVDYY